MPIGDGAEHGLPMVHSVPKTSAATFVEVLVERVASASATRQRRLHTSVIALKENGASRALAGGRPCGVHGMPIEEFTGTTDHPLRACGEYGLPFLIDCDFDAAERLLRHLYPTDFADLPASPESSRLVAFDQAEFFDFDDPSVSMAETAFLYIPADCLDDAASTASCRLHVAFHGRQQHTGLIGDDFYWDAGYNRCAEANRIVVLYPQATLWKCAFHPIGLTPTQKAAGTGGAIAAPTTFARAASRCTPFGR